MTGDERKVWELATLFAVLSLFTVGGGMNTVIPEIHRQAVEVRGWMTSQRFTDLFAIAQAAPGPNLIVATLIGWEVARLPGALVATLATLGPTSFLVFQVARVWDRFRTARWRIALQAGLMPLTIGMVAATGFVLARAADRSIVAVALTALTAVATSWTRIHPLLFLAGGGVCGLAGLI